MGNPLNAKWYCCVPRQAQNIKWIRWRIYLEGKSYPRRAEQQRRGRTKKMFLSVIPGGYIVYRIIDTTCYCTTTFFFLANGHIPFSCWFQVDATKENQSNDGILSWGFARKLFFTANWINHSSSSLPEKCSRKSGQNYLGLLFFMEIRKGNWNHCSLEKCSYFFGYFWPLPKGFSVKACHGITSYLCKVFMKKEREGKKSLSSVQSGGVVVFFFANICPSRERHILFLQVFVPNGYCYFGKDSSKLSLTRDE